MQTDEPISIVPYDTGWPGLFQTEKVALVSILGDRVVSFEHIGSTAVSGIWSKPVVDIIGGLAAYPAGPDIVEILEGRGYEYLGEAGVAGRQYFRKRRETSYNLHLAKYGSDLWLNNLLFRDYLRANPEEAKRYSEHKRAIIIDGVATLLAYSNRKTELIADMLDRARKWSKTLGK